MRQLSERNGDDSVAFDSAGFNPEEGCQTPARFINLARRFDVEIDGHRSKFVTREMIDAADAIFVMDVPTWRALKGMHGDVEGKTYFLGMFSDKENMVLDDPHSHMPSEARMCFERLVRSLDGLWKVLQANQQLSRQNPSGLAG